MKISKELAEFIGIVIGDGYVHKTNDSIIISGSTEDKFYYRDIVMQLIKSAFKVDGCIYFQKKRNACYISCNSKDAVLALLKIGFKRGKKNYKLPLILNKKIHYPHILRGLFDTDGCLKFSKQTKKINYYPRIQIALVPSQFSKFISVMLDRLGFEYGVWIDDNSRGFNKKGKMMYYHISGNNNLEKWMKMIGTSNPVHKTKYLFWKKYGHYKPKMKLTERFKRLNITYDKNGINYE